MNADANMHTLALKSLQNLRSVVYKKILVEKSISEQNIKKVYDAIGGMDWTHKYKYATALNTILKKSKTEEEIIMRAEAVISEITQGSKLGLLYENKQNK